MRKIISSKPSMAMWVVLILIALFMMTAGIVCEIGGLVEEKGAGLFCSLFFGVQLVLWLWALNRYASIISFEDGIVKRKGLIGGFYKECPVDTIQKVVVRFVVRQGHYVYLVDNSNHQFDHVRTDSYICFLYTEKNLAFLRSFWSGQIEE